MSEIVRGARNAELPFRILKQSIRDYFGEHRLQDAANDKVYEQRRTVGYVDFEVGIFYNTPGEVVTRQ